MANDELWAPSDDNIFEKKSSGIGALRMAMLFASGAIALALVVTPMVAGDSSRNVARSKDGTFDNLVTSSVDGAVSRSQVAQPFPKRLNNSKVYTIRRSVTQTSNEACIIYQNGLKTDSCD